MLGKVRVNLQEERTSTGEPRYHLLVVTLELIDDSEAMIQRAPNVFVKPEKRILKNLGVAVRVPHPERVKAVYRIPPIGYEMGRSTPVLEDTV